MTKTKMVKTDENSKGFVVPLGRSVVRANSEPTLGQDFVNFFSMKKTVDTVSMPALECIVAFVAFLTLGWVVSALIINGINKGPDKVALTPFHLIPTRPAGTPRSVPQTNEVVAA